MIETRYTNIGGQLDLATTFQKSLKKPIDTIVEDVLSLIGLEGLPVKFNIYVLESTLAVQDHYRAYHVEARPFTSAAYTRGTDIYISQDQTYRVLAHELAHAAMNAYFTQEPITTVLHELIAQSVEERICRKYSRWFW